MAGRTIPVHDLRELLRHLQATTNDSAVQRATGLNRRTIARYRAWAEQHALLTDPIPPLDELQQLVSTTLTIPPPPLSVCTLYCTRACSQRVPEFAAKVYHPSVASVSRVLFPQHSFSWGERYVRQEQRSYGRSRTATSPSHHLKRPFCRSIACYPSSDRPALPRLGF